MIFQESQYSFNLTSLYDKKLDSFDDSFNFLIGTTNEDLNFFDNPYISINIYEITSDGPPSKLDLQL